MSESHGQSTFAEIDITSDEILLQMKAPAQMSGVVTSPDGTPETDKSVLLRGMSEIYNLGRHGSEYVGALDEEGRYSIANIDPGLSYDAYIVSSDHTPLTAQIDFDPFEPGETRVWNYELYGGMVIRGRVLGEQSQQPIKDVVVGFLKDGQHPSLEVTIEHWAQAREARVEDDGTYELHIRMGPGNYLIYPDFDGVGFDHVAPKDRYGKELQLEGGEEIELDLTLPDPFTLSVRVFDQDGESLSGLRLIARLDGWYSESGATDEEGRYSWSGFAPGVGGWFKYQGGEFLDASTTRTIGSAGEVFPEETLVLYRSTTVEGVAVNDKGEPWANAPVRVTAYYADGRTSVQGRTTDSDGYFCATRIPAAGVEIELSLDGEGMEYEWSSGPMTCYVDFTTDLGVVVFAVQDEGEED